MSIKFKSPFLFNPAHCYTLGFWGFGVNASGKNARQSLLDGRVHLLELPLQMSQVAFNAG